MNYQIIYQFCLKNYENEYQMLDRIYHTTKDYHTEMMELEQYTYDLDFFNSQNPMILIDIIPAFLEPDIKAFNFDNYKNDKDLREDIATVIKNYVITQSDPEKCLVIQIIHDIPIDNAL
jgi:DNA-binding ferritin-like protein (Dps family)